MAAEAKKKGIVLPEPEKYVPPPPQPKPAPVKQAPKAFVQRNPSAATSSGV
jgi:hypothetical protein